MKNILLSLFVLTTTYSYSFAQTLSGARVSIGPEIGIPLDQANKVYNLVEGASVKLETPISSSGLNFTLTAGYNVFNIYGYERSKMENGLYIPIEIGLKSYVQNSVGFVEGDLGLSFNNNNNFTGKKVAFVFAPNAGVSLANNTIDISIRYEVRAESGGIAISQAALRLAYKFGLH